MICFYGISLCEWWRYINIGTQEPEPGTSVKVAMGFARLILMITGLAIQALLSIIGHLLWPRRQGAASSVFAPVGSPGAFRSRLPYHRICWSLVFLFGGSSALNEASFPRDLAIPPENGFAPGALAQ